MRLMVKGNERILDKDGILAEAEHWSLETLLKELDSLYEITSYMIAGHVTCTHEDAQEFSALCKGLRQEAEWRRFKKGIGVTMEVR